MPDKSMTLCGFAGCVGTVVYSAAGRDKKRPFVIVGVCEERRDEGMVYIANGKLHTLASPKLKKLKHLRFCGDRVELCGADDGKLREYLKSY